MEVVTERETDWDEERELKLSWRLVQNDCEVRSVDVHCPSFVAAHSVIYENR